MARTTLLVLGYLINSHLLGLSGLLLRLSRSGPGPGGCRGRLGPDDAVGQVADEVEEAAQRSAAEHEEASEKINDKLKKLVAVAKKTNNDSKFYARNTVVAIYYY